MLRLGSDVRVYVRTAVCVNQVNVSLLLDELLTTYVGSFQART